MRTRCKPPQFCRRAIFNPLFAKSAWVASMGLCMASSCAPPDNRESSVNVPSSDLASLLSRGKNDPQFNAGLDYLNENLRDTKMVGDPVTRRFRWPFHWDPSRCTTPRGDKLEILPAVREFDKKNAYWMSWLSVQAYRQGRDALYHLARVGLTDVELVDDGKTGFQAFIGATEDYVVVSFAGTSEWIDYLTDLTFASKPETVKGIPGHVHTGFLNVLDRSWAKVLQAVESKASHGKPVLLTGHSMGGAQAVISAVRLARLGYNVDSIYIYAVPRIGDETYAAHVEKIFPDRLWRFVNNEDLVPRLPPPSVAAEAFSRVFPVTSQDAVKSVFETLRYKHVGKLLIQDGRGGLALPRAYEEAEDVSYWENVFKRTQGRSVPQAVFANWRMLFDHIPFVSHCQLNPPRSPSNPLVQFVEQQVE
jgi:triacylglycerol lipase